MSQRIRVLRELGEEFERVVRDAPADRRAPRGSRTRAWIRRVSLQAPRAVAPALGAIVVIAIVLGAVLLVRPAGRDGSGPASGSGLQQLLSQYAFLRRPQTAADRSEAGPAPSRDDSQSLGASQGASGHPTLHYSVRITGLAHYRTVPELTRVVNVDGVRVSLFVEQLVPVHSLPKATVSGNDPKGAAREVTRARLEEMQRQANARPAYLLLARIARSAGLTPIAPAPGAATASGLTVAPGPAGSGSRHLIAPASGVWGVNSASLPGPGGKIVAVVPDGVARVSWSWPREFDSDALRSAPPVTVSAPVHGNVAVAAAAALFVSNPQELPETVVRYAAGGSVLARFTVPLNAGANYETVPSESRTPGPETPQSRRAERDPSTPNRVVIFPSVTTLSLIRRGPGPGPDFFFKALLNYRSYFLRLTGGPRPDCVQSYPRAPAGQGYGQTFSALGEPTVRGDTFMGGVPLSVIGCAGTYRLSVSVLGSHNRPYPPFGSATFTVR